MSNQNKSISEIAAVDLGSNSFRLQLAHVVDGQLFFHDSLREAVRLGAGLDANKFLSSEAQQRAIDCLRRFGERLRGFPPQAVRAVATNTFRVAKNASQLLADAEAALGFPIEIIAGREEARMIYVGVSHGLPIAEHKRLVIDIGGGSTEFIIGQGIAPQRMESLYMGCVSFSLRFFPDGKITERALEQAEIAAASEIQNIRAHFTAAHWQEAVGSSGTARALGEIIRLNGWSEGEITLHGLNQLRAHLLKARDSKKLQLEGLSTDRAAVLPGGLCIMKAAFEALGITRMTAATGALREGVLYELLGRMEHHDIREHTVRSFMRRYHADHAQAKRVQKLAEQFLSHISEQLRMSHDTARQWLHWAIRLHEIGISIAHSGYHKHSAYIVENADMPGFSRMEQETLSLLVRAQRRSLSKITLPPAEHDYLTLIMVMRLSILFQRNRLDDAPPQLHLYREAPGHYRLQIQAGWLAHNPLTQAELSNEIDYWQLVNVSLKLS